MNAKIFIAVSSLLILFVSAAFASAQNVLLFTFDDSGPNVTATVTGSFDTSELTFTGQATPRDPVAFPGATGTFYTFGITTATNIDLFAGANAPGSPLDFLPLLATFPVSGDENSIITPLSEYLEINVGLFLNDGFPNTTIGLAEGETSFDADALENNVIVFQPGIIDDLGNNIFENGSFLSTTPTIVLSDTSGANTIQFVLAAPEVILGDVNQDGVVNFQDISPFIAALVSGDNFVPADIDLNGEVNFLDIAPFIAILAEIL